MASSRRERLDDALLLDLRFDNQDFDCILSIGTGLNEAISLEDSRLSVLDALKKMATSSEAVHRRLRRRLLEGVHFRFDVVRGLGDITLSDWEKSSRISAHTTNYLAEFHVEGRSRNVPVFLHKVRVTDVNLDLLEITAGKRPYRDQVVIQLWSVG